MLTKSTLGFLLLFLVTLCSCEAIGGIFKACVWTGIIAVIVVVVLIAFLLGRKK